MTAINVRHPVASIGAFALMGAMFWFLSVTIRSVDPLPIIHPLKIEFTRLIIEEPIVVPPRVPPKRVNPPPPLPIFGTVEPGLTGDTPIPVRPITPDGPIPTIGGGFDHEVMPLVRINPEYPMRAAQRGITGWVQVEFTITAAGTVSNPRVVDAEPRGMFDAASLNAVARWKYNPRIVEGRAVERPGVRVLLRFNLDQQ